ncbi:MAG: hypothetical protein ABI779_05745 [Acidobacteriota bacterium]
MSRTLTFEIEGGKPLHNPPFELVRQLLSSINPKGPSYFVLSDETGSYLQAAGARLRMTVEHRRVTPFGLQHFVLGTDTADETEISINYSGGAIRLRRSEVLSLSRAIEIFRNFYETGNRPEDLARRETTVAFK